MISGQKKTTYVCAGRGSETLQIVRLHKLLSYLIISMDVSHKSTHREMTLETFSMVSFFRTVILRGLNGVFECVNTPESP